MKKVISLLSLSLLLGGAIAMPVTSAAADNGGAQQKTNILKEGKKIKINDDYYFIYTFPEKPKIGTSVLKVSVFNNKKEKVNAFNITAEYDMPSMKGHHASGVQNFMLNKNTDYLLPIHFAMQGGWAIDLTFNISNISVYKGTVLLNI